jgi:hypothetical protein
METIHKEKKEQTLAIATVRSLLKKNGFTVGSWYANGRIKGMANFSGGDLEIKGNEYDWKTETTKGYTGKVWVHTWTKFVNVQVKDYSKGHKVNMKKVQQVLENNGLKTKLTDNCLIVDNKKIK